MSTEQILSQVTEIAGEYGLKVIGAIAVWIIGTWIIKALTRAFSKMMDKGKTDPSLKPFLKSIIRALLKVMLIICVLGMLGIEMTSFIAILAAAGLAVGMALSGTLQNITVRAWVNAADYWGVFFEMNEKVYKTFDKEGLNIPYPQMDVHLQNIRF